MSLERFEADIVEGGGNFDANDCVDLVRELHGYLAAEMVAPFFREQKGDPYVPRATQILLDAKREGKLV